MPFSPSHLLTSHLLISSCASVTLYHITCTSPLPARARSRVLLLDIAQSLLGSYSCLFSQPSLVFAETPQEFQARFFLSYSMPSSILNTIALMGGEKQKKIVKFFFELFFGPFCLLLFCCRILVTVLSWPPVSNVSTVSNFVKLRQICLNLPNSQALQFEKLLWRVRTILETFRFFVENEWTFDNTNARALAAMMNPDEK